MRFELGEETALAPSFDLFLRLAREFGDGFVGVKVRHVLGGQQELPDMAFGQGVPQSRQEKAVVDVEPFGIALAFRPGDDVGGAQQGRVGDAGQGAAALPVIHQAGAKNVLADPLHHQTLGLGCPGQMRRKLEFAQRRIGQADAQRIDASERRIEFAQRVEGEAGLARAGHGGGGQAKFGDDACVVQGEKPWPVDAGGGQMDGAARGGRCEGRHIFSPSLMLRHTWRP